MKRLLLAATLLASAVHAATPPSQGSYAINLGIGPYGAPVFVPGYVPLWIDTTNTTVNAFGQPTPASDQAPLPVRDSQSAPFQGVAAMTPGAAYPAQRSIGYVCTAAGPITLTLADGSSLSIGIVASPAFQSLPFAVTQVTLGSGTAGMFWGLK